MNDYYLGNGSKRPKKQDYLNTFGWYGSTLYTLDKIKYEKKQDEKRKLKETNKKASQHFKNSTWF